MQFKKLEGYLYKLASNERFIQMHKYYKRYFVLDPVLAALVIKKRASGAICQTIAFRDIYNCTPEDMDRYLDSECEYKHVFQLATPQRTYRLYADLRVEKLRWISSLKAIALKNLEAYKSSKRQQQ